MKQKLEREGKGYDLEGIDDKRFKTEFELICVAIDEKQANDPSSQKSEEQLKTMKLEEERKIYGRLWVWEGYYNENNN